MKTYGVINYYDDFNGLIKGTDGIDYILNNKNINVPDDIKLQKGDYVEFVPEQFTTIETNLYIARNIKKVIKENVYNEEQSKKGMK